MPRRPVGFRAAPAISSVAQSFPDTACNITKPPNRSLAQVNTTADLHLPLPTLLIDCGKTLIGRGHAFHD